MSGQQDVYYVMFDSQPSLYDTKVYFLSRPIGEILGNEKIAINGAKLTINIDDAYQDMMKENTVFFENMGKLNYTTIGSLGKAVEPGAKLLGFDSKISLYWFKTRTLLSQSSAIAARKADQLFRLSEK